MYVLRLICHRYGQAAICAVILGVVTAPSAADISLMGMPGVAYTPVASDLVDGEFVLGGSVVNWGGFVARDFSQFDSKGSGDAHFTGYLTFSYLPRLVITVRGNGMPGTEGPGGTGPFYTDGMMSVQLLLARQGRFVPALAVGMHDLYGFMLFNQAYAVATHRLQLPSLSADLQLSGGWGVDWYDRHIGTDDTEFGVPHYLLGPFASVVADRHEGADFSVEYDTHGINFGIRVRPLPWMGINLTTIGIRGAALGLNLRTMI